MIEWTETHIILVDYRRLIDSIVSYLGELQIDVYVADEIRMKLETELRGER